MSKLIKMPSIGQYRNAIHDLLHTAKFAGVDENGDVIYDEKSDLPEVEFTGTVKVHGTNASFCLQGNGDCYFQSKGRVLSIENDNAGFCFFGTARLEKFKQLALNALGNLNLAEDDTITIYGEFAGGNIQKGVGVSGLDKMFILFGAKVTSGDEEVPSYWVPVDKLATDESANMYNIYQFGVWKITIDLSDPAEAQNVLIDLTNRVEQLCPVAKYFGRTDTESKDYSTVGEGIVWEGNFKGSTVRFKVKGEKHSTSKVKKLASVDPEKMASIKEFVAYTVTENRLNQGIEQVFAGNGPLGIEGTGDFIKWVKGDIFKEETDTLLASGLEASNVAGPISRAAAKWFKDYLNKQVGL